MSAGVVATAYVRLRPTSAGFQKEADAQVRGALTGAQKLFAAGVGIAGIAEGIKTLAEAASEHQSAVALTEKTVENAGASWRVYGGTVETALDKQARASGISFQELYQGFIRLETQLKDTPKALHALGLAEDVARARHIQLGVAATALARASTGNIQSLSRLGIVIAKVSPLTDELKQKLLDITTAQEAQTEAGAKQYKGTINLTDSQLALSRLSPIQLKNLTAQTSAQLAAAAAQDKTTSGTAALAEVQKRFGGEAAAFAQTAAGSYQRFRVSVEESAASLGAVLLPTLTRAAEAAAGYADELGKSKGAADAVATGAHDVGQAVQAVVAIIKGAGPVFQVLHSGIDAIGGVGPIVVAFTAYKTLGLTLAVIAKAAPFAGKAVALFAGAETAATVETVAQTTAVQAQVVATAELEAAQLSLFRAEGLQEAQQTILFTETVATTGAIEAETVALEATTVAATEAEIGLAALSAGPVLLGIAAVAGGLYVLNSYLDRGTDQLATFRKEYASLQAEKDNIPQRAAEVRKLVTSYVNLGSAETAAAGIAQGGAKSGALVDKANLNTDATAKWIAKLQELEGQLGSADPILKGQIERLVNLATAANRIPSKKTITLVLNDRTAIDNLELAQSKIDELVRSARGLGGDLAHGISQFGQPTGVFGKKGAQVHPLLDPKGFDAAIGAVPPAVEKASHQLGSTAAKAFSTSFETNIDASGIGTAFRDAITQAQAQLVSETGTLASTIGQALDAKLKAETLPATREIARLQAQIATLQGSSQARDSAQAIADAQKKLTDLQRVYGAGALTSDQAQQVAQAQTALADAQSAAEVNVKQARIASLQVGVDAAGKANEAAKAAATKRLADLSAELNDGLISQQTFVKRLNGLLAKEGVNYKTTGKLLGQSLADGFRDGVSSILAQAAALGGLGQRQLAGAPRGTKAVNPAKAEADAIKSFLDSVAGTSGKFTVSGAGSLPPGVTLASLLARAGSQRAESSYEVKQGAKTDKGLDYAGRTADHTALAVAELRKLNSRPVVVHVTVDGKAKKRKTAEATRS